MDFQVLAKGIALAGCAIGAGCSLIAGIGPGIGEGNAVAKAAYLTPVPGGVGPMTITMLMKNTLKAAKLHHGIED